MRVQLILLLPFMTALAYGADPALGALLRQDWAAAAALAPAAPASIPRSGAMLLSGYAAIERGAWRATWEGFSQLEQGETREALLAWAEQLLAHNPQSPAALMIAGDARARAGKYEDALQAFDSALEAGPAQVLALHLRGLAYALRGDAQAAAADFQAATDLDGRFIDAAYSLALLSMQRSSYEDSVRLLTAVLDASATHFLARNARGVAYAMRGDYELAEQDFDRVLQEVPAFRIAAQNLDLMKVARARGILQMEQLAVAGSPKGTLGNITIAVGAAGTLLDSAVNIASQARPGAIVVDSGNLASSLARSGQNVILRVNALSSPQNLGRQMEAIGADIRPDVLSMGFHGAAAVSASALQLRGRINAALVLEGGLLPGTMPRLYTPMDRPVIDNLRSLGAVAQFTASAMQAPNIAAFQRAGIKTVTTHADTVPFALGAGGASVSGNRTPGLPENLTAARPMDLPVPGGGYTQRNLTPLQLFQTFQQPSLAGGPPRMQAPKGIRISFQPDLVKVRSAAAADPAFLRGESASARPGARDMPADGIMRFPFTVMNPQE